MENTSENRGKLLDQAILLIKIAQEKIELCNQMRKDANVSTEDLESLAIVRQVLIESRDW